MFGSGYFGAAMLGKSYFGEGGANPPIPPATDPITGWLLLYLRRGRRRS